MERGVLGISARCPCGWRQQTVDHVLRLCPHLDHDERMRHRNLQEILEDGVLARAAAKWLVLSGVLRQFQVAKEMDLEDRSQHQQPESLQAW